jgi:hypothetical protein
MFSIDLIWDISMLFAVLSGALIISSELLSPFYGKANIRLSRKRLNQAALCSAGVFFATMGIRVAVLLINS